MSSEWLFVRHIASLVIAIDAIVNYHLVIGGQSGNREFKLN